MAARSHAATARGVCAGAIGGALAGAVDYALGRAGAAQFLPDGSARLAAFLIALYAGMGALSGGGVGLLLGLIGWATDLGALTRNAFADPAATEARRAAVRGEAAAAGARWLAYVLAGLLGIAALGGAVYGVALTAILRFHGHLLIAALIGVAAAGLAIPAAMMVLLLASVLSPVLRFGPRARVALAAPPGWMALFWTAGLLVSAAGVLELADKIELMPRMTPAVRAFNVALWSPVMVAGAIGIAHALGRFAWRRLPAERRKMWLFDGPVATVVGPTLLFGLAVAGGIAIFWSTAKLLPWKPFVAGGAGVLGAAAAALLGVGKGFDGRSRWVRALPIVVVPALLLGIGFRSGGAERVRKAAIAHAGLAAPLIDAIHSVSDLDRDGYSSLLGSDCDDWNAEVHPGAFDWPDDGIDQDCNGHQASAVARARPPFAAVPPSVPKQPDVILITIDAVRADHIGAYGYGRATSPAIDAFAKEAVLFKNGWAHSPSTRYSVPAILTGRYESTIAFDPKAHWPPLVLPENRLMAEMFKQRGYHTAALVPTHYLEPGWGLSQGFDEYDHSLERLHGNPFHGDPARASGSSSKELADLAVGWIEKHKGEPFFLWMHFYDPHYLYEKHEGVPDFGATDLDQYDGELAFTDLHVARVMEALKGAGLWEKSIVIVTSDHGESLGEHGVNQHGYHIYSQIQKVPFIVRVPGIAPRVVEEPVGHVDLFPSLLNLIGGEDEGQLLGRSFVDLMMGSGSGLGRRVFGEVEYEGPVVRKSVATKEWHLIHNVVPDNTFELYHLSEDPQEAHDLAGSGLGEEKELKGELGAWMDEAALPADFAKRVAGSLSEKPIDFTTPVGADVGGLLTVAGVEVKTPVVKAGGQVVVDLVYEVKKPIRGWRLFTHLTGQDGRFLNADHQPVEGLVPLERLKAGQWVRDRVKVAVPANWPAGPLAVELGLYRGGERAKVVGRGAQGDKVVAATIQVGR